MVSPTINFNMRHKVNFNPLYNELYNNAYSTYLNSLEVPRKVSNYTLFFEKTLFSLVSDYNSSKFIIGGNSFTVSPEIAGKLRALYEISQMYLSEEDLKQFRTYILCFVFHWSSPLRDFTKIFNTTKFNPYEKYPVTTEEVNLKFKNYEDFKNYCVNNSIRITSLIRVGLYVKNMEHLTSNPEKGHSIISLSANSKTVKLLKGCNCNTEKLSSSAVYEFKNFIVKLGLLQEINSQYRSQACEKTWNISVEEYNKGIYFPKDDKKLEQISKKLKETGKDLKNLDEESLIFKNYMKDFKGTPRELVTSETSPYHELKVNDVDSNKFKFIYQKDGIVLVKSNYAISKKYLYIKEIGNFIKQYLKETQYKDKNAWKIVEEKYNVYTASYKLPKVSLVKTLDIEDVREQKFINKLLKYKGGIIRNKLRINISDLPDKSPERIRTLICKALVNSEDKIYTNLLEETEKLNKTLTEVEEEYIEYSNIHFKLTKKHNITSISLRTYNDFCSMPKNKDGFNRDTYVRQNFEAQNYKYHWKYDVSGSVFLQAQLLHGCLDSSYSEYDVYSFALNLAEKAPEVLRKASKDLCTKMYMTQSALRTLADNLDIVSYYSLIIKDPNKNEEQNLNKVYSELVFTFYEIYNRLEKYCGGALLGANAFEHESFVYLKVANTLRDMGYKVVRVYDCFYVGSTENDIDESFIASVLKSVLHNLWETNYKELYDFYKKQYPPYEEQKVA